MKFDTLKTIADLKEQFENLVRRNTATMAKADEILMARRERLHGMIVTDFTGFFTGCEFDVRDSGEVTTAVYKSLSVTLKSQNPGRRTEDVSCLLRYLMTISADHEEMYTIYVRSRNGSDSKGFGSKTPRSDAEKALIEILTEEAVSLARLHTDIRNTASSLTDESQVNIMTGLENRATLLQQEILERRGELETGSYFLAASPADEEWNREKSQQFETLETLLKNMDQEPPVIPVPEPDPVDHLMDSEPFIG